MGERMPSSGKYMHYHKCSEQPDRVHRMTILSVSVLVLEEYQTNSDMTALT
jgi:hypothetical protein